MGYITKDGRMAAGYVVNTTLPLRYFTFLPKQERFPLHQEPSEQDLFKSRAVVGHHNQPLLHLEGQL